MRATRCLVRSRNSAIPLTLVDEAGFLAWKRAAPAAHRRWTEALGFSARPGTSCVLPSPDGSIAQALAGVPASVGLWDTAALPGALPAGVYRLDPEPPADLATRVALAWSLATYTYETYKKSTARPAELVWPAQADRAAVARTAAGVYLVRDLVNAPAEELGPGELAAQARSLARAHGARCTVIRGDDLLAKNYPGVHLVGRAASREPRLIDLRWSGSARGKKITLVGKGVVFDSGGLDIKPAAGMKIMKKDMGGAAHVLALAEMIMAAKLPVRLRVIVPAVENAISGNAFRPLDVYRTRKGLTVEVGNTDAEGRLVLADALAEADGDDPDLLIDFATLTGAARIALGADLPAFFTRDDRLALALGEQATSTADPVWRLPIHAAYRDQLESPVADLNSAPEGGYGGAITAALFLAEFVRPATPWIHIDVMAWNQRSKPGRPVGGEAMGLRAVYGLVESLVRG